MAVSISACKAITSLSAPAKHAELHLVLATSSAFVRLVLHKRDGWMDFVVGAKAPRLNLHGNSSRTPGQEVALIFKSIFQCCLFADYFPGVIPL